MYSTPASACSPSSWPNFHHDIANSGDYTRDAIPPGVPLKASASEGALHWTAPGGDLMCGKATSYQIVTSQSPITAENFAKATPLSRRAGTDRSGHRAVLHAAGRRRDLRGDSRDRRAGQHRPAGGQPKTRPVRRCRRWADASRRAARKPANGSAPTASSYAPGKGNYNWLAGPGAKKKLTGQLGAVALETRRRREDRMQLRVEQRRIHREQDAHDDAHAERLRTHRATTSRARASPAPPAR